MTAIPAGDSQHGLLNSELEFTASSRALDDVETVCDGAEKSKSKLEFMNSPDLACFESAHSAQTRIA